MRAPYTQLYVHLVWATWDRLPVITSAVESKLYPAISAKCRELKCELLAIGGDMDHVHLLILLPTTMSVAAVVKEIKGTSSHLMTHEVVAEGGFKWQGGYGAFTVSKNGVKAVIDYIQNQKAHHAAHRTYEEWEKCGVVIDENKMPGD